MKLTFTCWLGFFFLFICVCVFIIQKLPQKSENQHFTIRLKRKKPSSDRRNIGENDASMVDSYACSVQSPKSLLNLSRQLITPTLFTEPGSLHTRGWLNQILMVMLLRMCLFFCKTRFDFKPLAP